MLLVLLGAGVGADTIYRARPRAAGGSERTDLPVYLAASRCVLDGRDPLGVESARGWPYWYPPTLAVLLIPLATLPPLWAAAAWYAGSALSLGAGALALRRTLGLRGAPDRWELLAWLGVAIPTLSALLRGQVGPLLLGLVGIALRELQRGRQARAGVLIGLAAAIKLTPGVLLPGLVGARRWGAALACALSLVGWLVLLPAPFLGLRGAFDADLRYGRVMLLGTARDPQRVALPGRAPEPMHIATNQSLGSQVLRRTGPGPLRAALLGLLGLALLPPLWLCWRRGLEPGTAGLLLGWTLIAAPVSWHHHHVLLTPALLALGLIARAAVDGWERTAARVGLVACAGLGAAHFASGALRPFGLLGWGTLAALMALALVRYSESPAAGEKKS